MAESEKWRVDAGVLRISRELDEIGPDELGEAIGRLVGSGVAAPVVDLGDVSFVPSYHIGGMQAAAERARRDGRSLTVCGKRNVIILLERMGLGSVARLKPIQEPPVE